MPETWLAMTTALVPLRALTAFFLAPCLQGLIGDLRPRELRFPNRHASVRFTSRRWPTLLACFLTFSACSRALGAVEGFDESFDGNGPYSTTTGELSGLDNPGWRFETAAGIGVLDGQGYSFDVGSSRVNDSDTWWRSVPGYGSFREVVRVSDLDMGFYSEGGLGDGSPRSQISLRHYFRGSPGSNSLDVYFARDFPGEAVNNAVYLSWYGIVPRVSDFELGLEFDQSSKEIWTWLDSPETGRIMTGPRKISASPADAFTNTELYLGKSMDGKLSGRIDHWSVVPLPDTRGDINDDGRLNIADADLLSLIIRRGDDDAVADLTRNGKADQNDLGLWIHFHRFSYFGDANLDGQFNSQDLTLVFQAGEHEDLIEDNSGWADGDWNADGEFSTSDLVVAFQDGGYEQGPRPAVTTSVPEPSGIWLWLVGLAIAARRSIGSHTIRIRAQELALSRGRLACCLAVLFLVQDAQGSNIVGFDESFDGTGPYATTSQELTGLENPNWKLLVDGELGDFDGKGYVFEHRSHLPNGSGWKRNVIGNGSFRQSVKLSQLNMSFGPSSPFLEPGSGYATVSLAGMRSSSYFSLLYDPARPEGEKVLEWGFSTDHGAFFDIVPLSFDIEIGIEQDFERKVVWGWFDSPTTGRIVKGPLAFTPYEDNPSFIDVRFVAAADGGPSYIRGRLENWSLEPLPDIRADINDDGVLNTADVDMLSLIIRRNNTDAVADLSIDGKVDQTDLSLWIHDHRKTYFGDANLDGQFNSRDLTLVFQAGEYEDFVEDNSGWSEGDWNADGEFSSSDLVVAFQDGGYEKGPRAAEGVPEPGGVLWAFGGLVALWSRRVPRVASR